MKRYFTFRNEKSDKFWVIENKEDELMILYGKNHKSYCIYGEDVSELCSEGNKIEKLFDTNEECEKEAAKLIAKKIKEGYVEQEELFIAFYNEVKYLCRRSGKDVSRIDGVLAELDKREKHLVINYGSEDMVNSLNYNMWGLVEEVPAQLTNLVYHMPKLEAASPKIEEDFLSFYGLGLRCAAFKNDENLDRFCHDHVPVETKNKILAIGLAYSAARWKREDEFKKYLEIGFTHLSEESWFKDTDFCKPYENIIEARRKRLWN